MMHRCFNNIPGLVLALMVALTSQSMALARGQMYDASGAMVICTGTGPVSVLVDREGQPVERAPICPDCAFSFLEYAVETGEFSLPSHSEYEVFLEFEITDWPMSAPGQTRVRGPPLA